ncbi:MAG: tetratricopeptide repeat protein [Calditrichaeota bacterium]|nr:MAG: tetratricopeptide repeat protein [Calditrichota bacterium]
MFKKISFTLVTFLLIALMLVLTESLLRLTGYGTETRLFVSDSSRSAYIRVNTSIGRLFFPQGHIRPHIAKDLIRRARNNRTLRIFVFGGSSAAGWPYYYNATFARMLHRQLEAALPRREVEVVNFAMPAVNSYSVRYLVSKSLTYQPDAILIYAGHNEYYGAFGAASAVHVPRIWVDIFLEFSECRLFQALTRLYHALFHGAPAKGDATLMERMVGRRTIRYGSVLYKRGLTEFKNNMQAIVSLCQDRNIPLYISSVASNTADQAPFISLDSSAFPARSFYVKGRRERASGRYDDARRFFGKARDFDALRFRAPDTLNRIIQSLAGSQVYFVDGARAIRALDPHGLTGNLQMTDHLHPNPEATRALAGAFYKRMIQTGVIDVPDTTFDFPRSAMGVTALDQAIGNIRVAMLKAGWPFRVHSRIDSLRAAFTPATIIEKLAWEYWNGSISWHDAHYKLGQLYESQQVWEGAAREYRAILYDVYLDAGLMVKLAAVLLQTGQSAEALTWLKRSVKIKDNFRARSMMGLIYVHDGHYNKAIHNFEKALTFRPDDPATLYNLAGLYRQTGKMDKARALMKKSKP